MKTLLKILLACLLTLSSAYLAMPAQGKVVRQKLTIAKEGKGKSDGKGKKGETESDSTRFVRISADRETEVRVGEDSTVMFRPEKVAFTGYDKPATARYESFHVVNDTPFTLRRCLVKVVYRDMKGRMLHSRTATFNCYIPGGEARKVEIPTWDIQNSFYYYLSNEPRRVASPYRVEIHPLAYWVVIFRS